MDEFDDLDGLLDMEADLQLEPLESKKRGVADASSQQEVEAAFGGSQKRPRGDPLSAIDDEELLEYAARMPFSQLTQDECQQGSTPPHGSALPARKPGAGALRQQPQAGATDVDEELDIEALLDMEDDAEVAKDAGKEDTRPTDGDQLRQTVDSILPVREYVAPQRDAINIQGDFLTVTSEYGQRVYASVAAAEGPLTSSTRVDIAGALRRVRGGLLSGSIQQLMAEVENDRLERALAESGDRTAIQEPSQGGSAPAKDAAGQSDAKGAPNAALWVDRYSPKGFMDLLSDEQINRDVVRWLKSWDPCVFGRDPPPEPTAPSRGGYSSKKAPATAPTAAYHDDLKRPEHKVILLCGPPGLGKTTLAHVVARHCGYRPVEINASDDRSGSALLSRVTDAAEMRSVVGEKRPNCIIIDEIDGAVGGSEGRSAIAALLKLVTATGKAKGGSAPAKEKAADAAHDDDESDDEEGGADAAGRSGGSGGAKVVHGRAAGGKKKPQLRPLLRPIICICNDLYAPALRPLREVAKVFQFRRPSAERVAHRLQMVCAAEGLRAEKSTLRMLAERAECDVRSCLNTLQFLAKRQRLVRQRDVAGLNLGQKDMTKGAFQVWGELLQKKKAPTVIGRAAETDAQRTSRLFNTLLDFGEPDLVLGGVHESLPHMRFFDMAMQRTSVVLTHMQDADALMRHAMRTGDMSLFKYLPAATLSACSVIAGPDRPTLQWPKAGAEARRREVANRAILQQWLLGMAPALYAALGPGPAALDMLPMLPSVTTPALRPVSRHLFSPEERVCVDGLVDTLLTLGLKYSLHIEEIGDDDDDSAFNTAENVDGRDKRTGAGAKEPPLQFRPQVHRLWHFRGLRQGATTRALPMAARQMVLHEAEMEGIRRSDAARQAAAAAAGVGPMEVDSTAAGATAAAQQHAQRAVVGHVPLDLNQRLREAGLKGKGVVIDAAPKRPGSWLDQMRDRQRAQRGGGGSAATGSGDDGGGRSGAAAMPVLYKFHEGYTNAVKRPIRMTELLA